MMASNRARLCGAEVDTHGFIAHNDQDMPQIQIAGHVLVRMCIWMYLS
jgi:hypothetical protein